MRLDLGRLGRTLSCRLLLVVLLGLAAALSRGTPVSATTFLPSWSVELADTSPGAASSMTVRLGIPSPDANFGQLLNFIPPEFEIAPGDQVPNGAMAGTVKAEATLGLVNNSCSTSVTPTFEMMEASIDPESSIPIYSGFYDYNNNGLPDNVDYYPSFLSIYAPQLQPVARYYGQTVVAGTIVPLNFVVYQPGAPIPLHPPLDPALGYPTVVIIGDPIEPIQPITISDFCTPLGTETTLFGVSGDNPGTPANENGVVLRRNPAEAGAFNSVVFARSRWDADADGVENDLDPCPYAADTAWDPRDPQTAGDADEDGLPDSCDPNDGETATDQDSDGFLNRQDPCPRFAEFAPFDSDRDGVGDSCDLVPDDPSDAGANHRHELCLTDTIVVGSPTVLDPPPVTCPSGADLPVPPVFRLFPEESMGVVGSVHSVQARAGRAQNGGPAVGVQVLFEVTGANTAQGSCLTDNFGYCQFNYLGANAGLDVITASATIDGTTVQREARNDWVLPPDNDAFAQAKVVEAIPFEEQVTLVASGSESDEPADCSPIGGGTLWYRYTPVQTTFVLFEAGSEYTPLTLAAYTGGSLAELSLVACDRGVFGPPGDDAGSSPDHYHNGLSFQAVAGVTYHIQLGTFDPLYLYPEWVRFSVRLALPGDANCSADLSALDALDVLRQIAGLPASACAPNGDMNCDGALSAVDALLILRVVAALAAPPAPCTSAATQHPL